MSVDVVLPAASGAPRTKAVRSPWLDYLLRRLTRLFVSIWVLMSAAFAMIHLVPGDPVRAALGLTASPQLVELRQRALGLNHPLWRQYIDYLGNTLKGDFGTSIVTDLPVSQLVKQRLPATVELALLAFVLVLIVALPLGAASAVWTRGGRNRPFELAFVSTTVLLAAIPAFLLAVVLVYVFSVRYGWLPIAGRSGPTSYVLPVISLALGGATFLSRIVRREMLGVLDLDYIRTARSKRIPSHLVYLRHALPNALTATLTYAGLLLTGLMAGTVFVENVFAWPGLGTQVVQSIQQKDYPVAQALILIYGGLTLAVNLVVDIAIVALNRRTLAPGG
jgi:peptide/nickel transport system permease protein